MATGDSVKTNYFSSERWDNGIQNKISEIRIPEGVDIEQPGMLEGLAVSAADLALTYYDRRIRAHFARAGIDIGQDVLTVEAIRKKIDAASGLDIVELSARGISEAIERQLAAQLSELLGFVVTKVFDTDALQEEVKAHVVARLVDGEGGGILKGRALSRLRNEATWARAGISAYERRQISNRWYQRKYRKKHDQTWVEFNPN